MKLSIALLAIAIVVEFIWLGGIDRYADRYSASIEASEFSHNPWPATGDQAVSGRSEPASSPGILPDVRRSSQQSQQ